MLWKCSPNSQTCQNWFTRHTGSSSVAISVCDSCWDIWWLLNGAAPLQTLYLASALVACLDELHDTKGLLGDALQPRCGVRVWFLNLDTNGARFHALCRKLQKDFEEFDSCAGNSCHAGTYHQVCMIPSNLNRISSKHVQTGDERHYLECWDLSLHPFSATHNSTPRGQCTFAWRKRLPLCWNLAACPPPRSRRLCGLWALKHQRKSPKQTPGNPIRPRQPVKLKPYMNTNGEEVNIWESFSSYSWAKISKLNSAYHRSLSSWHHPPFFTKLLNALGCFSHVQTFHLP